MYKNINQYINAHTSAEDEVLFKLRRETHQVTVHPQMLSGNVQGNFLKMLVYMLNPKRILEIGTFTAYSAICMARGLNNDGVLLSIERNDEIRWIAEKYVKLAKLESKIQLITGDALSIIPSINDNFDMVFIDGDKREYPDYLRLAKSKLNNGGFIVADNVLWGEKVIKTPDIKDKMLMGVLEFNQMIVDDNDLEHVLLPIRDGLMLIRKKHA